MDLRKYKPPSGAPEFSRNNMFGQRKSITEDHQRSSYNAYDHSLASADFAR